MSEWQPIETAPKNKEGDSYGVWLVGYHDYDKSIYQMRWECNGPVKGWMAKGQPHSFFSHRVSHWMPLPVLPGN